MSLSSLTAEARETLHALRTLTDERGRLACRSGEIALELGIPTSDAAARLGRLEDHRLAVPLPGSGFPRGPSGARRWRLTDDGRGAIA